MKKVAKTSKKVVSEPKAQYGTVRSKKGTKAILAKLNSKQNISNSEIGVKINVWVDKEKGKKIVSMVEKDWLKLEKQIITLQQQATVKKRLTSAVEEVKKMIASGKKH